jgi:Fe-S-cluster containining protein
MVQATQSEQGKTMEYDVSSFFQEYEKLVQEVNTLFESVQQQCPDEVTCSIGCCDCCYAMFDLTLVEAMYINQRFQEQLDEQSRTAILERANQADRQAYKIKRQAYKSRQQGVDPEKILQDIGRQKVRCPLLDESNQCLMYEFRPVTCRIYGIPMQIGGEVHTCSLSGFNPGQKYPTVFMDKIQDRLLDMSQRMVESLPTKHTRLAEVLVPLSMALLTEYDQDYLGLVDCSERPGAQKPMAEWTLGGPKGESDNG